MRPNSTLDKKYTTGGDTYRAHSRMPREKRKELLDKALYKLLKTKGLHGVTKSALAAAADVSTGLLHTYYGGIDDVRKAGVLLAVEAGDLNTVRTAVEHGFNARELPAKVRKELKN